MLVVLDARLYRLSTNKDRYHRESVPANAHIVELATVVQIQMILKKENKMS